MDDLSVLTVEATSIQFFREKPGTNRVYKDALGQGVLKTTPTTPPLRSITAPRPTPA